VGQHSQKIDDDNDYQLHIWPGRDMWKYLKKWTPKDGAVADLSFGEKPGERKMYLSQAGM
jgi:hypothetical protein